MHDLVRAQATAGRVLSKAWQHLQGSLLRHDRIYRGVRALDLSLWTSRLSVLDHRVVSSKWRNRHTVVSSSTGSPPRLIPSKRRIASESYSNPRSDRLKHCCKK